MNRLLHLLAPLAMLSLLTGCIKERYEDCEWYTLTFSYEGEDATDIFAQRISDVNLFIYDVNNRLVQTQHIDHEALQAMQGTKLNVEHGTYRVVAIGNALSHTQINNYSADDMSQNYLSHPNVERGGAVETNDALYLGTKIITLPEYQYATEQIAFRSAHRKISYKVIVGEADPTKKSVVTRADERTFTLKVKNLLPLMDFTGATFGDTMTYSPTFTPEGALGNQTTLFNVLRPQKWDDVEFELSDAATGEIINTLNLGDFLAQYPQIDINAEDDVLPIEVHIEYKGDIFTNVTITIPDWLIQDVTPEYGTN